MAVGLTAPEILLQVNGIKLATTAAGIRYSDRDDMVLITMAGGSTTAGVFTTNKFCAAPVTLARQNLAEDNACALLINAGNANAGTGAIGMQNAETSCHMLAGKLGIAAAQVLPFSTGVIGEQLPMAAVSAGIDAMAGNDQADQWLAAASAIMTTDTIAKGISERIEIDGHTVTITGIAKGSGMICPNMATLRCFVATDAAVERQTLQSMLNRANAASFNRITVDSDTSTNDSLVLIASGQSGLAVIHDIHDPHAKLLYAALQRVLISLATAIIRDAEGATKFVEIEVVNGRSEADCAEIAYSVAHSPLVKTALFASDPNWGRLLMAVGKSKVAGLDVQLISITINGLQLIEKGEPAGDYTEQAGKAVFAEAEIKIVIDLGIGKMRYQVWTSDLSHDYVSINADYRS